MTQTQPPKASYVPEVEQELGNGEYKIRYAPPPEGEGRAFRSQVAFRDGVLIMPPRVPGEPVIPPDLRKKIAGVIEEYLSSKAPPPPPDAPTE